DAIRAAGHDDPSSPTGAAVRDYAEYQGDRAKRIAVDNLLEDARQKQSRRRLSAQGGRFAIDTSFLSASATLLGGVGKAVTTLPGGGSPDPTRDPTRIGALY